MIDDPLGADAVGWREDERHRSLEVLFGQRQPRSLIIKNDAGNPEAPSTMHNLDRIDASRECLAIVLRIPVLVRAPHLAEITELLDAARYAALEEACALK